MKAKISFKTEEEKRLYVEACDHDFEERLDRVMKEVCREDMKYLTLSGPTCSGKTTASKKLISEFSERGKNVKIISLDDFFRDAKVLTYEAETGNTRLDFDSEKALDLPVLEKFMDDLQNGREVALPRFDFSLARRTHFDTFSASDDDIIVFEGIQAIYPAFTSMFKKDAKVKSFYISVLSDLQLGDVTVSPREVRLWRRIVRDYRFRAASPEFTFLLWEGVTANEDVNILPFADNSDFRIDSLMGYEACMLKEPITELLGGIPKTSEYYEKSIEIMEHFKNIDSISEDYLPKQSLYHEFL